MHKSEIRRNTVFDKMIQLINEGGWTQDIFCENKEGKPCFPEEKGAVKFSLYGAFEHVFFKFPILRHYRQPAIEALIPALNLIDSHNKKSLRDLANMSNWIYHLNKFNDTPQRSKEEVVKLLEMAKEA